MTTYTLTDDQRSFLLTCSLKLSARKILESLQPNMQEPLTEEAAYQMGAKGAEPTEVERLLFEAWMRGHCWALCATWDGKGYRSDAEQGGELDPRAIGTRRLWAAWRDRAALQPNTQEPLTVQEIEQILARHNYALHGDRLRYLVRMTEQAHNIGVKP